MDAGEKQLRHIAVIMDGNGRWANGRGMERVDGHRQGLQTARAVVRGCARRGIPFLTLFAFSRENWHRPPQEVDALLRLFSEAAATLRKELVKNGVRLSFIGERDKFSLPLRTAMSSLEKSTAAGRHIAVTVAVGYSGRWDIVQAVSRAAADGKKVDEENFANYLSTVGMPPPDLLIRTGGENRLSNFMLWQLAYTELYFSDRLWPDFSDDDLQSAVDEFYRRERRFGKLAESEG